MRFFRDCFCTLTVLAAGKCFGQGEPVPPALYFGMCDASAAVAVVPDKFLVANDEDNVLRLYSRDAGGRPMAVFDLGRFLRAESEHPETDIEGAARLGDAVFWITSHGRNKNGKSRPNRYRLFATKVVVDGDRITVAGVGTPYTRLLEDLLGDERLAPYRLDRASRRAPKDEDALNIEGLAATADGALLMGFRNPIRDGKSLVVPIENPRDVVLGGAAPRLSAPIELDLGGLGVRSLEYNPHDHSYLVIAGPHDGKASCRLFRWSGRRADSPVALRQVDFGQWTPEALVLYADRAGSALVLSDDGTKAVGGIDCKDLPSDAMKNFRGRWIKLN